MTSDPHPSQTSVAGVEAVVVLGDDLRRRVYDLVRRARGPVTREQAAGEVGISVKLAAFHLDKLVTAGLLRSRYDGAGGVRRVGRKPKVYEPAGTDIRVSIPERHHDVLAEILIDAVLTERPDEDARSAALRAARHRGTELGAATRARVRPGRLGPERSLTLGQSVLERCGFEPYRPARTELRLLNCPFHPMAARSPGLVCALNHAFAEGLLAGLRTTGVDAVLAPRPGHCCVELRAASAPKEHDTPPGDDLGGTPGGDSGKGAVR